MKIDDETLSAYIDGELAPEERRAVETALADSPELARRLDSLKAADQQVEALLGEIDRQPMPDTVTQTLQSATREAVVEPEEGNVVAFRSGRNRSMAVARRGMALAASLALLIGFGAGLMTGSLSQDRLRTALFGQATGEIGPAHPLYGILQTAASGERQALDGGNAASVLLSFRSRDNAFCRELAVYAQTQASRGVYCRSDEEEGTWRIYALASTEPSTPGYAAAAGEAPAVIEQSIDRLIAGQPLGPEAEARAIENGWNR